MWEGGKDLNFPEIRRHCITRVCSCILAPNETLSQCPSVVTYALLAKMPTLISTLEVRHRRDVYSALAGAILLPRVASHPLFCDDSLHNDYGGKG